VSRMNEDDEKLKTFITEKEDWKSVQIIGGVKIFLPRSQGEASTNITEEIGG
jgi:hypothetical protein